MSGPENITLDRRDCLGVVNQELYEAEKDYRLFLEDLSEEASYKARVMCDNPGLFALDILVRVKKIVTTPDWKGIVGSVVNRDGIILEDPAFNPQITDDGFLIQTMGSKSVEKGYFVSAIDEWDLALNGLIVTTRDTESDPIAIAG